ncbi:MAG: hypothetical protein Q7U11_24945 [Phenylobacterium sp.]|nr:hypothetical protein [Phenylobacterium sp.]
MDVSQINWAYEALAVFAALLLVWTLVARRAKAGAPAAFVGLAHLVVAGLHSAAPIRGYLDPGYVGYGFGLLAAESGLAVTVISGAVWVVAVLGAFLALARARAAMAFVALSSAAFAVIVGAPLAQDLVNNPAASKVQLGEYLTIPGLAAIGLMLVALVLPFVVGFVWAIGRMRRKA